MGLVANDIIALTYEATYAAQQIRYAFHYRVTTPGSSTTPELDLLAMATNFSTPGNTFTSALQAVHVNTFNFDAVSAQRVYPIRTIRMQKLNSFPGGVVNDGLPPNVAVVVTKRTLTPGRPGIGSLHLSGTPDNVIVSGEVTNLTPYTLVGTEMIAARTVTAVAMGIEPGLFNPTGPPSFFSRLFDAIAQRTSRVMRRRTVRVGI